MLKLTAPELVFAQTKSPYKIASSTLMEGDAREIKDLEQASELSDALDQEEPMAATEATEA